ncbi:unnamed protein product [Microthlaspi erraticum]|uniref:Retrotransposon gag domain-containing protein n=1 Tax=Microthlaspi erraticum TaxID=1685480 RepID=A0A6D2IGV9_9BRAS|nr:unnamed protein product [Microthlaspi erraticum]
MSSHGDHGGRRNCNQTEKMSQPVRVGKRATLEFERINRRLDKFISKVHRATSSVPELTKELADTWKSPLSAMIRRVRLQDKVCLKIKPYTGVNDHKKWLTTFNLAMTREKYNFLEEREGNYYQVFIEHMTKEALVWFLNLFAESINNFDELTNAFLKHYSMHMTWVTQNTFTMTQSRGEPLRMFMEKFKRDALDLGDMPDCVSLEALRNGLWYDSKFKEDLSLRPPTTLEDVFHRSQSCIFFEEDQSFYAEKHGEKRPAPLKPMDEAQEPRKRLDAPHLVCNRRRRRTSITNCRNDFISCTIYQH